MRVISELSGKMQVRQARTAVPAIRVAAVRYHQATAHRVTVRAAIAHLLTAQVPTVQVVVQFHPATVRAVVRIRQPLKTLNMRPAKNTPIVWYFLMAICM